MKMFRPQIFLQGQLQPCEGFLDLIKAHWINGQLVKVKVRQSLKTQWADYEI